MDPISLQRRVDLDVSVDELWALIADPAHLAGWLGEDVQLDLRPGGIGAVADDGVHRVIHVDHVEDRRALGFSWWEHDGAAAPSRVRFEISELADGGSRLEITETLAPDATATDASDRSLRWEARVCSLWACTVVAALVP